jgi:hypothetical protein
VRPALFFSLLIITVSFLPVFTLEAQEGRMFAPLAYTKTSPWQSGGVIHHAGASTDASIRPRKIRPSKRSPLTAS